MISPTKWNVPASYFRRAGSFDSVLDRWRQHWSVPPFVALGAGDRKLTLNLDNAEHRGLFRRALEGTSDGRLLGVDAAYGHDKAWLGDGRGVHHSEIAIPLLVASEAVREKTAFSRRHLRVGTTNLGETRRRAVGGEWLYLKFYGPSRWQDTLLIDGILELIGELNPLDWFFVRYADPDPHLRVRLRGETPELARHWLRRIAEWNITGDRQGLFGRLEVAEYEREVERYGGEKGIALAESFFTLSSKFAVAQLLLERQSVEKEIAGRLLSVVCSVDRLLAGSGLTAAQRMTFCDRHTARSRAGAEVYRRAAGRVYEALVEVQDIDHSAAEDAGQLANFVRSGHALRLLAGDSSDADAEMRELLSSYIHMHCNRLLRSRDDEAVAIDLLRRGLMTMRARAGV